jgi:tetratricopeptide (TPR) repeat protein
MLGCETTAPATSFSAAVSRYEEGRYDMALSEGQAAARSDDSTLASQGALVAGMSAFKLGQIDLAERLAKRACESPEQATAGSGWVLLGDIRLSQRHANDAAECFDKAAARLTGPDAARASECARRARAMLTPAASHPSAARAASPSDTNGITVVESEDGSKTVPAPPWVQDKPTKAGAASAPTKAGTASREYTIRAGSYQSADAARKRAASLAGDLNRAKAPAARVDEITTVKGETLYAVRIGSWATRVEAERVMNAIGRRDLMVGAITPH